jgi:hypothetical protein
MDEQALQEYYFFDQADLAPNRNGGLSVKQAQKLPKDDREVSKGVLSRGVILIISGLIFPANTTWKYFQMGKAGKDPFLVRHRVVSIAKMNCL